MERIENFVFNDIVLYAKGWYQGTENLCEDLGYFFSKVYGWTPKNEDEVSILMLRVLDKIYAELHLDTNPDKVSGKWLATHSQMEGEIRKQMRLYNCTRAMAIIYSAFSVLHCMSCDEIKLNPPVYGKKEKFRLGCIGHKYPISQTYKEMNRIAREFFTE